MLKRPHWLIIAALTLSACSVDLSAGDAIIVCGPKGECPTGFSCDPSINRCVEGATDRPTEPSITLGTVHPEAGVRYVDIPAVPFTVDDRNIPGGDRVAVSFEFSVGTASETWFPAAAADGPVQGIDTRNTSGTYRWDALADATAGVGGLTVDPAGFVAYVPQVRVRAVASDSTGLASSVAVSEPFAIGNTLAVADLRPFERESYAGLLAVQMNLVDEAQDDVTLEVEFRYREDQTWRRCDIAVDLVTEVPTTPEGNLYLVAWRTDTPPAADAATPQGVGRIWANDVEMRSRAVDHPEGSTDYPGPWSAARLVGSVRNQTPPQISELEVQRTFGMIGTGRFALTYVLADAENDRADVRVEMSIDGNVWTPAVEYPSPLSEGVLDLAASPVESDGTGGVRHVLVLDPAGTGAESVPRRIRLIATDGFPPAAPLETVAEVAVGDLGATYGYAVPLPMDAPNPTALDMLIGSFTGSAALDVAYISAGNLYINTGNGDGTLTFPAGISRAAGSFPVALTMGRFDADALDDIASVDQTAGTVRVYLSSAGTPFTPVIYATCASPQGVTTGRFNNDAFADLAVSCPSTTELRILHGSAAGTYSAGQTLTLSAAPRGIDAADLDGDGHDDLVATHGDNLVFFFGDGSASPFTTATPLTTNHVGAAQLAIGDFNGDGARDVAVGFVAENQAVAYKNAGARSFQVMRVLPVPQLSPAIPAAQVADLNGDGSDDLLLAGGDNLFIIGGDKITQGYSVPVTIQNGLFPSGIAAGDLNGDLQLDIAYAGNGPDENINLFVSNASPYIGGGPLLTAVAATVFSPGDVASADFNVDGVPDLAVASEDSTGNIAGRIGLLQGRARFGAAAGVIDPIGVIANGSTVYDVVAADLNLDGFPDIAALQGQSPVHLLTYENRGDGTFTQRFDSSVPGTGDGLALGDFNHDGIVDLVMSNTNASQAVVFMGAVSGTWSGTPGNLALGIAPNDITVGDFDGDSNQDIASCAGASVVVRRGNGAGGFSAAQTTAVGGANLFNLAAGDINDDGRDDLLVVGVTGSTPLTALAAAGTFSVGAATAITSQANVFAGDRNNDGVVDFVSLTNGASNGGTYITTRGTRLGTGALTTSTFTHSGTSGGGLLLDLNGDGAGDIATSTSSTNQVQIDWAQDVKLKRRPGTDLVASGNVTPTSARWSKSNAAVLGRTMEVTGLVRDSVVPTLLPPGYNRRFLQPVTAAEKIVGDVELQRLETDALTIGPLTGPRLRIAARLGPLDPADAAGQRRLGLDLSAATPRGVVIELPILTGQLGALGDGSSVRVFIGAPDWLRASELASDPLTGAPDAAEYLPRIQAPNGGYRDVIVERVDWLEVPRDADGLLTGSQTGRRFEIDAAKGVVRVLTDRLGHMQAYLDTSP